jgi:signal transduction histidine kinase
VLGRIRPRSWGLSARLTASYVLVTLAVVVLVEGLVLGYQAPHLANDAKLQAQVSSTAKEYLGQLLQRYAGGVPTGTLLGERGQRPRPGRAVSHDGITLVVPAIAGPISSHKPVTAVVVIAADGTIIASSAPARYQPGQSAATKLPAQAAAALANGNTTPTSGPSGSVSWTLLSGPSSEPASSRTGKPEPVYLYIQAPLPTGFVNPIRAWNELRHQPGAGPLINAAYVLLIVVIPVGVLFGLLASHRLVRRVRRLERATLAVADGDYTVSLPTSGRDEVGRLETNFNAMTRQLDSALYAERQRATIEARAGERTRIAREIHDAISQHLFSIRMIAGGLRKRFPDDQQLQAIEQSATQATREMQALLLELNPAELNDAELVPALEDLCDAYRSRLGIAVDAHLDDVSAPPAVEHALLRITQEACTNAVRHGNTRRLAVSLTRRDGHIELGIRDTGSGFDPVCTNAGAGLRNIRDRVAELGGTLHIDSTPGHGTAITVRVPAS